jgi:hypothetical protein
MQSMLGMSGKVHVRWSDDQMIVTDMMHDASQGSLEYSITQLAS